MIGLVIVTHGGLATEFRAALEHIVGPQTQLETIAIGAEDDMALRRSEILDAVKRADTGEGVILLTDMFGGTPSNLAISVMDEAPVEVIAGINLPMLIKVASMRKEHDLKGAVAAAHDAVESADGQVAAVAQIALPPDEQAMLDDLPERYARIRHDPDALTRIGETVGRELSGGGPVIRAIERSLFVRFSGSLRDVDGLVIARIPPELDPGDRNAADSFEAAILDGVAGSGTEASGAELTTTDPGTLAPFIDAGIATVDDLDLPAGEVALDAADLDAIAAAIRATGAGEGPERPPA